MAKIRHSKNGINSTFSSNSPLSPTAHLKSNSPDSSIEESREQRRQKVLQMLKDNPDSKRAFVTDTESDPDNVILTLAIRDQYSFEMLIPKHKYDPFLLLELIEKCSIQ